MKEPSPEKKLRVVEDKCTGCLNCALICSFSHVQEFNPEKSLIRIKGTPELLSIEIDDRCDHCMLCAKYCAYGALEIARTGS